MKKKSNLHHCKKNCTFAAEMIRKHRHIIISLLIANLLVSNIGLSVNWMYCFCKGQMQVSLFSLDDKCKKEDNSTTDFCQTAHCDKTTEVKPCCKKFEKYQKTEKPCTQKGKKHLKADLKFFLTEKEIKNTHFFDCQSINTKMLFQDFACFLSEKSPSSQLNKAPPPRLYGRNLLVFTQNFRC